MDKKLTAIFEANNLRLTQPRLRVFEALSTADNPLSMHDIVARCADVDRVSVYRTLDLFHRLQILDIVHVGWKKRYELVAPFKAHHHHLHCNDCGNVIEINSDRLERFIEELTNEYGFRSSSHTFEIAGLCVYCQAK